MFINMSSFLVSLAGLNFPNMLKSPYLSMSSSSVKVNLTIIVIAVLLDYIIGDPYSIPHPIRYIGKLISFFEKKVRENFKNLKLGGYIILILSVIIVAITIFGTLYLFKVVNKYLYYIIKTYIIYSGIAGKCLYEECMKVYKSLKESGIEKARIQLSYLVGRDTNELTEEEVIKATIETASENTIDGVISPLFFAFVGSIFNIPAELIYLYKTVNTLDSMIGYNNEKYGDIGFASAKADDILNIIPARFGALFIGISGVFLNLDMKNGIKIMFRDRKNHKSPNCAYPEGMVAGLMNIQLGGTHNYFGKPVYKPTIGDRRREVKVEDIVTASKLVLISQAVFTVFSVMFLYEYIVEWLPTFEYILKIIKN